MGKAEPNCEGNAVPRQSTGHRSWSYFVICNSQKAVVGKNLLIKFQNNILKMNVTGSIM